MKVLTGLLPTPEGEAALAHAAAEARHHGAELVLVAFVSTPHEARETQRYATDRNEAIRAGETRAEALRPTGLEVSVHAPIGAHTPADAILQVADEQAVDLIVIGMRRRSRVGKLVLGSTAQDIILGARAPVVSVKPTGDA
jgi:nucleotide-binding universal stress UspA family protein